jgi:antitoxin component of MazEF toxin-antitoxin module
MELRKLYQLGTKKHKSTACIIPPEVLREVGLKPGDWVQVSVRNGEIILTPVQVERNPPEREIERGM